MAKYRTIISANIDVDVVKQLHGKTKGTRSRVIERALRAYLADREAFDIEDISSDRLLLELAFRKDLTDSHKALIQTIYKEVKQ